MTERPNDELPEHERRPETETGGGITSKGGTAAEMGTDPWANDPDADGETRQPESDIEDPEPEDPNGPEVAYQPRSI